MTVNEDVLDNDGGDITLTADGNVDTDDLTLGANVDITVTGNVGFIELVAGGDLIFGGNVTITTAGGNIDLLAGTDFTVPGNVPHAVGAANVDLDMTNDSLITSNNGDINLQATGNVDLGNVDAGTGNISVTADFDSSGVGEITDGNGAVVNLTGNVATLSADSGIGDPDEIETAIVSVTGSSTTTGAIRIAEADDITLTSLTTAGADADDVEVVSATGNIEIETINAGANGDIFLDANAAAITDTNDNSSVTGDDLQMTAITGIGQLPANDIGTAVNDLAASTTTGDIYVVNTGNLTITTLDVAGFGNTVGVSIVGGGAGDDILVQASSPLTIDGNVTLTGAGSISLAADGNTAADTIDVNASVIATGDGRIELVAGGNINVAAAFGVSVDGDGNVDILAGTDFSGAQFTSVAGSGAANADINMADTSFFTSFNGDIQLSATGDTTIARVDADANTDATRVNVIITADEDSSGVGAIIDGGDSSTDITGNLATLSAATGIGSGDAIETDLVTVNATNTNTGDIQITEVAGGGNLIVSGASETNAAGGEITISTTAGALTISGNVDNSGTNSAVTLSATGGNLDANAAVTSTGGNILIRTLTDNDINFGAGGNVTSGNGDITVDSQNGVDITAGNDFIAGNGNLTITIDSDDDDAGPLTLTIGVGNTITANDITLGSTNAMGAGNNDIVDVNSSVTAGGFLTIQHVLDAQLASGITLEAQGGNVDISNNVGGITLDGGGLVTIQTTSGSDGDILLVAISETANEDLTVTAEGTIDFQGNVDLGTGNLIATVDSNNNGVETLQVDQVITADDITLSGSANADDTIDIDLAITAGGFLDVRNAGDVQITNVTLEAQGGDLTISTNVNGISLDGGANTTTTLQTTTAGNNDIVVAGITSSAVAPNGESITMLSRGTVTLNGPVDLNGGNLTIRIDSNDASTETLNVNQTLTDIDELSLTASTVDQDDTISINSAGGVTTTAFIFVANADTVNVNQNLNAGTDLDIEDVDNVVNIGAVMLTAQGGNLDIINAVTGITLNGGNGNLTTIRTTTADNDVNLAATVNTNGENLTVTSTNAVTLTSIDLTPGANAGTLIVTIDSDDDSAGALTLQVNGQLSAGIMTLGSGTGGNVGQDDIVDVDADLATTVGALTIENVNELDLAANVDLIAQTSVAADSATNNVNGIDLSGTGGTNIIRGVDGNVDLAPVTDTGTPAIFQVDANVDITLASVDISGNLDINLDTGSDDAGILTSGNLSAAVITADGQGVNDTGNFNGTVTSTVGNVTVNQFNQVNLLGDVTAATNLEFSNINTSVDLGSNVDLVAMNGDVLANNSVTNINLSGVAGSNNIIDAQGATGNVNIGATITDTSPDSLTINSNTDVTLNTVDIDGNLDINFSLAAGADTLTTGNLQAGNITVDGTGNDDTANFNGIVESRVAGVTINQINQVNLAGNVTGETTVTISNANAEIDLADAVDILAENGNVDMQTGVTNIDLSGAAFANNSITSTNADNEILLAPVSATNGANLTITSDGAITSATIDLSGGNLDMTVDNNDTTAEIILAINGNYTNINNLDLSGSANIDDIIDINADITVTGRITADTAADIQILAAVPRTISAGNGDVTMSTNVTQVSIDGAGGNVNISAAGTGAVGEADVSVSEIVGGNDSTLNISAEGGVTLNGINTAGAGDLGATVVTVDSDGDTDEVLTSNAIIDDVDSIILQGTTDNTDDSIIISGNVTTTAAATGIIVRRALDLDIGDSVTLDSGDTVDINVGNIDLSGGTGTTNTFNSGNDQDVNITANTITTSDVNGDVNILINSEAGATITGTVNLSNTAGTSFGDLTINFDTAGAQGNTDLVIGNAISGVGQVLLNGPGAATGNNVIDIDNNITAEEGVTLSNVDIVDIAVGSTITAKDGDILAQAANVNDIRLSGVGPGNVTLIAQGTNGDVLVDAANGVSIFGGPANAPSLIIQAEGSVAVGAIDLNGGTTDGDLLIEADTTNLRIETLTTGNLTNINDLTLRGGTDNNENITLPNPIVTTGFVLVEQAGVIEVTSTITSGTTLTLRDAVTGNIGGNLVSGTSMTIEDITGAVNVAANVDFTTTAGNLDAFNNVNIINVLGGAGISSTFEANGGDVNIGPITSTGANVTITSTDGVDLRGNIDMGNGDLTVTVDDDTGSAETLQIDQDITNANDVTLNGDGTAAGGDVIDIDNSITAGGALTIQETQNVDIAGGLTLEAQGGNLDIDNLVGNIILSGAGLVTLQTTTANFDIELAAITGDGNQDLTISSTNDVDITTIALNTGNFVVTVDSNDDIGARTLLVAGILSAGDITLQGGSASGVKDDIIDIDQDLTAGGFLTVQNAGQVQIDASAARAITANGGDINISIMIGNIALDNSSSTVTLDANGVEADASDSDVLLAAVVNGGVDVTGPSLTITADGRATFSTINLDGTGTDGSLSITVDDDDDTTETLTINGNITNVAAITLAASPTNLDDTIDINSDLTTTAGALTVQNANSVLIDASGARTFTANGVRSVAMSPR